MFAVGLAALFLAAIVGGGIWPVVWQATVVGIFGYSVLAIIFRRKAARAFWIGFAVFGTLFFLAEQFEIRIAYRGRMSSLVQRAIEESPACNDYFRQRADSYFTGAANTPDSVIVAVKHTHLMETAVNSITQLCTLMLAGIGGFLGHWTYLSANRSRVDDSEATR